MQHCDLPVYTIEDLLMHAAYGNTTIFRNENIKEGDRAIIASLANQVKNNLPLTQGQYKLAVDKMKKQREYFFNVDFDKSIENLKQPLRDIDKSRWIRFENNDKNTAISPERYPELIAVRFSFNHALLQISKKLQRKIPRNTYDRHTKIRYFESTERNIILIVDAFREYDFKIDDKIIQAYDYLMTLKKENHVPGIYDYQIKNLSNDNIKLITSKLGNPTKDNLHLYRDQFLENGLVHFDPDQLAECVHDKSELTQKIIHRNSQVVKINPQKYPVQDLFTMISELDRYPVLAVIPSCDYYQYIKILKEIDVLDSEQISVLFRATNTNASNREFNEYLKTINWNNPISDQIKLSILWDIQDAKSLIKKEWYPKSMIIFPSTSNNRIIAKLKIFNETGLIVHYNEHVSYGIHKTYESMCTEYDQYD